MSRRPTACLAAAAASLLVGCSTPSLNGIAESDRVTLDGLEGVWVANDTIVRIEASEEFENAYVLYPSDSPHTLGLVVANIDGRHVADVTLNDDDTLEKVDPVLLSFVIPVHKFARLRLDGDTLEHAQLKDDWVGKHAGDALGKFAGDENVLTGSSAQLRAMLAKAVADENAWEDGQTFTRLVAPGRTTERMRAGSSHHELWLGADDLSCARARPPFLPIGVLAALVMMGCMSGPPVVYLDPAYTDRVHAQWPGMHLLLDEDAAKIYFFRLSMAIEPEWDTAPFELALGDPATREFSEEFPAPGVRAIFQRDGISTRSVQAGEDPPEKILQSYNLTVLCSRTRADGHPVLEVFADGEPMRHYTIGYTEIADLDETDEDAEAPTGLLSPRVSHMGQAAQGDPPFVGRVYPAWQFHFFAPSDLALSLRVSWQPTRVEAQAD